jgi:hypothetical protein
MRRKELVPLETNGSAQTFTYPIWVPTLQVHCHVDEILGIYDPKSVFDYCLDYSSRYPFSSFSSFRPLSFSSLSFSDTSGFWCLIVSRLRVPITILSSGSGLLSSLPVSCRHYCYHFILHHSQCRHFLHPSQRRNEANLAGLNMVSLDMEGLDMEGLDMEGLDMESLNMETRLSVS